MNKTVASAIATGALLLNTALPAFAVTIQVSNNGSDSASAVTTTVENTKTVVQDNTSDINNNVSAHANSGGNSASGTTGGNVTITTDSATTVVGVSNTTNANVAQVNGCCNTNADVTVSDNGEGSDNAVDLGLTHETSFFQTNVGKVNNHIDADATSGDNSADGNTNGDVDIHAGSAGTTVLLSNTANANIASVGGTGTANGSVSAQIMGNGEDSYNSIALGVANSSVATQDNYANLTNDVYADATSGDNSVEGTTDGDSSITTDAATVEVGVDNLANFNFADLDCGCLLDVLASISENGEGSDNAIEADLVDAQEAFQTNVWTCNQGLQELVWDESSACNNVDAGASSGDNSLEDNTGDDEGTSAINAGSSDSSVVVGNTGNANVVGGDTSLLPSLDLGFDLGDLSAFLSGLFGPTV